MYDVDNLFTLINEDPDDEQHTVVYNSSLHHQHKLSTQSASNMSSIILLKKTWEPNHKLMNEQADELLKYVNISTPRRDTQNISSWRSDLGSCLDPVVLFERSVKCIQCSQVTGAVGFDQFQTKKCTCNIDLFETSNASQNNNRHENSKQACFNTNLVSERCDSETKSMEDQRQFFRPKFGHPRLSKVTNQPTTSKLPPIYPDVDLESEDEIKAHKSNVAKITFKTAKEQLLASNPAAKRTLGTSRKAQAKFVSPMIGAQEKQESCEMEMTDERLKHIDPKMIELIESEIIDKGTPIGWDDIAGLHMAKSVIQEAVVWPLLRPDLFTGLRKPPKGILLFGPPGTGKTLIGKCVAAQCRATFFSISASSLTSKWIGDGEKMVRALFAVARCHQPAVIFIDEIDSLLTQRNDTEHEATRRIKTEFLVQFDGAATADEDRLLVVGATNRPQELDEAARRRLVKRLYIPLPDVEARNQLITNLLKNETHALSASHVASVSRAADGFSGADVAALCGEAAMGPVRALPPCSIATVRPDKMRPVNVEDFMNALRRVRPSVSQDDLEQYIKWNKTFGQGF